MIKFQSFGIIRITSGTPFNNLEIFGLLGFYCCIEQQYQVPSLVNRSKLFSIVVGFFDSLVLPPSLTVLVRGKAAALLLGYQPFVINHLGVAKI